MQIKLLLLCASLTAVSTAQAATITNNITGVGPQDSLVNPYFCIQDSTGKVTYSLEPGKSVDGNQYSGNEYYVGGSLRFGGCTTANAYLGYVGFDVSSTAKAFQKYDPPAGVHVSYINPAINSTGSITGKITYTAIKPNFNLVTKPPAINSTWPFVGVNLSGLEFSKMLDPVVVPNLSQEDAAGEYSDLAYTQTFINNGVNTVRVPVSWGYLQLEGAGKGPINSEYFDSYVKPTLETLTSAGVYTIVDLHSYMRYSKFGQQYSGCSADPAAPCPDGNLVTDEKAYQDLWTKLYTAMKNDPEINMDYIILDLVNEPVGIPDDLVFTIQASVIKKLRESGFNGYILVEGNAWTGLHSWTTKGWRSTTGDKVYTNATLFTRENFVKAGVTDLSKIVINVHQYFDSDYSGTHDQCQTNLTTQGSDGFNLNLFVDYLQQNQLKAIVTEFGMGRDVATCAPILTSFFNYLSDNAFTAEKNYGFVGWTIWSTGHGWGDYMLRVKPNSYQATVMQSYLQ